MRHKGRALVCFCISSSGFGKKKTQQLPLFGIPPNEKKAYMKHSTLIVGLTLLFLEFMFMIVGAKVVERTPQDYREMVDW